jgi:hypothetical protein
MQACVQVLYFGITFGSAGDALLALESAATGAAGKTLAALAFTTLPPPSL